MKPRVLVTGAGGPAGVNVIRVFKSKESCPYLVVGADIDRLASGLYLADKAYLVPSADSENYVNEMIRICNIENIDFFIPTVNEELLPLSMSRDEFENKCHRLLVSSPNTIKKTVDKYLTSKTLEQSGISAPKYGIPGSDDLETISEKVGFPAIIKPRFGRGSRDIVVVNNSEELGNELKRRNHDVLVQEFVDGPEYTVDTLFDESLKPIAIVQRERLGIKSGVSVQGRTVKIKGIDEISREVAKEFNLAYASNIQMIVDNDGVPKITEINPRFSGGMPLSIGAGVNLPQLAIQLLSGEKLEYHDYKAGVYMTRHWEDIILDKSSIIIH